jgi:hypothetical protein
MMEEVSETEYRELMDNPSQETTQGEDRPMLVVQDDESLLDMDEEDDEIIMLERAIADTPSAPADGEAGTADSKGAAASPPAVAATGAATTAATAGAHNDSERVSTPPPDPRLQAQNKVNDPDSEDISDTQSGYVATSSKTGESSYFNYSKYGTRSRIGEGEKHIGSEKLPMSSNYYQCRAARGANLSHITYKVGLGPDAGTCEQVSYQRLGSFECQGDTEIMKTFRGSRITQNGETVNQNMTSTFDPANLKCVVCEKPHYTGCGGNIGKIYTH